MGAPISLTSAQRYNDGVNDGSQAALTDRQNGNPFNSACDPTGAHTSDGQHTTTYCSGWAQGYTSTWNGGHQQQQVQPAKQQSTGPDWHVCKACFWCASCLNRSNVISKCPVCANNVDGLLDSTPISNKEVYRIDCNRKRGITLEFAKNDSKYYSRR